MSGHRWGSSSHLLSLQCPVEADCSAHRRLAWLDGSPNVLWHPHYRSCSFSLIHSAAPARRLPGCYGPDGGSRGKSRARLYRLHCHWICTGRPLVWIAFDMLCECLPRPSSAAIQEFTVSCCYLNKGYFSRSLSISLFLWHKQTFCIMINIFFFFGFMEFTDKENRSSRLLYIVILKLQQWQSYWNPYSFNISILPLA